MNVLHMIGQVILLLVAAILSTLAVLWLLPLPRFESHPQPVQDYAQALARVEQLQGRDSDDLYPECRSLLLTHGRQTQKAIVLLHGITSCPALYSTLSRIFYELGYNVLVPRLPHHGQADPMTEEVAKLTAEELAVSADEAVDIAAGLGQEVTVVGFSTGGTMAAWLVQERPEVDQIVLISPFISPKGYPAWMIRPLSRILLLLPNQFWWWDSTQKDQAPGPRYGYDRYPTHAMAQIMRLSLALRRRADQTPPQSGAILVITNAGPRESVDNTVIAQLMADWQTWGTTPIRTFELSADLNLEHNYIDKDAPNQFVDLTQAVHPLLVEQITQMGRD